MKEEPVEILDEETHKTGLVMLKSEAHKKSLRHSGAHLWIYNSRGELLLQLRHRQKVLRPNVWDVSVAGHIRAGDTPEDTIVREAKEELNLDVNPHDFIFVGIKKVDEPTTHCWTHRVFNWTYMTKLDIDLKTLKLEKDEVSDIRWVPIDEFEAEIRDPQLATKYTSTRIELYEETIGHIRKKLGRNE